MAEGKQDAAAKKRSEAAKKAAATRKAKQEAEEQEGQDQSAQAQEAPDGSSAPEPYKPKHLPLQNAGLDQQAAHDAREAERAAQRDEHNARTAKGVLETQRGRKVG